MYIYIQYIYIHIQYILYIYIYMYIYINIANKICSICIKYTNTIDFVITFYFIVLHYSFSYYSY